MSEDGCRVHNDDCMRVSRFSHLVALMFTTTPYSSPNNPAGSTPFTLSSRCTSKRSKSFLSRPSLITYTTSPPNAASSPRPFRQCSAPKTTTERGDRTGISADIRRIYAIGWYDACTTPLEWGWIGFGRRRNTKYSFSLPSQCPTSSSLPIPVRELKAWR